MTPREKGLRLLAEALDLLGDVPCNELPGGSRSVRDFSGAPDESVGFWDLTLEEVSDLLEEV